MFNNKHTLSVNSTLLLNKTRELTNQLKIAHQSKELQTKEALTREAATFLSQFFKNLSQPIFNPRKVSVNQKPELELYQLDLSNIRADFDILFAELENLEAILIANFDFTTSRVSRLTGKLKLVYSKLSDYILYSGEPSKDFIYVSDSFNNLSRIDFNTKLINSIQAEVDQVQGAVTLPIITDKNTPITISIKPIINTNSNGAAGNNHELGALLHDDISIILDNNPDTWFEYEKVVSKIDNTIEPLILDIVLNLDNPQIVNYIRVNPNNFGTKNPISIETIETSLDGKDYINIKDDIPVNGFSTEDEENVFQLAPSTSKFAGQGVYTFTARKAKYIHLVFKQTAAYPILDKKNTTKYRYAIGIRDIEVAARPYAAVGEVISTIYSFEEEISKLLLVTNQNPTVESELASIKHYVSPDDGLSWYQIRPKDFKSSDTTLKPILNFNTLDTDSIKTKSPVLSIRYKALLERYQSAFTDNSSSLKKIVKSQMELHTITDTGPFGLKLDEVPLMNSIKVMDPQFGSRGIDTSRLIMAIGNGASLQFYIPFTNIKRDYSKSLSGGIYYLTESDPEEIRINGKLWTKGNINTASSTAEVYDLDYVSGLIKFGNDTNGKAVPDGAEVDIKFKPERLYPSHDTNHIAILDYPSSHDKKLMTIKQYGANVLTTDILNKGSIIHRLSNSNLVSTVSPVFSDTTVFATLKTYINGTSELTTAGDYSIDYTNGIVFSFSRTSTLNTTTVTYTYQPVTTLRETDWDFISLGNVTSLSINHSVFTSVPITVEQVPSGISYFNLQNLAIVKDTIRFAGTNVSTIFAKEVPFINGRTELINAVKVTEKLSALSGSGNKTITLRLKIINNVDYETQFSNKTVFATKVNSEAAVNSVGKYYIDRTNSKVIVNIAASVADPGTTDYYYSDDTKITSGLYSINYKTGEVFCSSTTGSGLTVDYKYSNYQASYYISRQVDASNFTFDAETNTVLIKEREVLQAKDLKHEGKVTNLYQIVFDMVTENREHIDELEPFFTPILKDYAIKVVPKSVLSIKEV